jgi:hypothetical protein
VDEKPAQLCKSHIIPEAFYKPIYESGHKIYRFTQIEDRPKRLRKGIYERLLCESCETRVIKEYEDYAIKVWHGEDRGPHSDVEYHLKSNGLEMTGLDYRRMKLFFMLILWRIGVSSQNEFKSVNLGPHEEKLRNMIINDDPGEVHDYGTILIAGRQREEVRSIMIRSIFVQSHRFKVKGHSMYRFGIGGMVWHMYVSSHMRDSEWCSGFLQKDGTMRVYQNDVYVLKLIKDMSTNIPSIHNV